MGPIQSLADLLSLIRRRLPLIATVVVIGLLTSLYLAVTSPPAYEARAVIQVNAPVMSDPVTRAGQPASLRLQQIELRLMSRENMTRLIERYNLYTEARGMPESKKIEALRADTRLQSVASSGTGGGGDIGTNLASIIISARAGDAQTAANIANDLANDVVTSDRRLRDSRIVEANDFLRSELTKVEGQLDAQDNEIAAFVSANEDSLADSRTYLQTELVGLIARETATEQTLMELQRERATLERSAATDDSTSVVQQIRAAEVALAQARRTLPTGHPEIIRLEQTIRGLTQGDVSSVEGTAGRELSLISSQIANLEGDIEAINQRRSEIQLAQSRTPDVMQTYTQMQRSRQILQAQYDDLSRRVAEIDSLRLLSDNDQTENMAILEPAVPPEFPLASNRKRSALLGAFMTFAIAAGLALMLELMNPVLRNAQQFEAISGLRPIAALPYQPTEQDEFSRMKRRTYVVVVGVIGLLVGLWMADVMPTWLANMLPPSIRLRG